MRTLSVPPVFNIKLDAASIPVEAVTTPTILEPPPATSTPPAVTLSPLLAVIKPTESILVTSSYVRVPPILTSLVKVVTPATTLDKLVRPTTRIPFGHSGAPVPFLFVILSTLILDIVYYFLGIYVIRIEYYLIIPI